MRNWIPLASILTGVTLVPSALLAIAPGIRERSWRRWGIATATAAAGIAAPLLAFFAAIVFTPEWKGGCRCGWLDCFHTGKLALLPLVFWALAAFYTRAVWRTARPDRPWIKLGLLTGALVAGACLVHGLVTVPREARAFLSLSFPAGTAVEYGWLAWLACRAARPPLTPAQAAAMLLTHAPWWALAVWLARWQYATLPTSPPSCFVVTAASRGHPRVVGALTPVPHGGVVRLANRQLATFWTLEDLWRRRSPASHRRFRRVYNVLGPRAARCLAHPLAADAAYCALRPFEIAARAVVRSASGRHVTNTGGTTP